ncbi:universal stress protein [Salmonella enterica subsp. enterica serovar Choleraesuis]|nr:universal stress protein [Salmonella enterica subsp. enterica serovar Choleraesuis]
MNNYHHILVLIRDKQDGVLLLEQAVRVASLGQARITLGHVAVDYQAMNYVSDSLMNDVQSQQVIGIKSLFSELVGGVSYPVTTTLIISLDRMKSLNKFITENQVDLLMAGHKNRLFGSVSSDAMNFVNSTTTDVLIKHIPTGD